MDSDILKWIIIGVVVVIVIILIVTNIRVVPQANAFIIETLGKYSKTWEAGIHVKLPFISRIVNKVDLREQVLDTPPQPVITKDNVTIMIDAIAYYSVFDAKLFTYGAKNPVFAFGNLSSTALRNIIGGMTLDEALTSRDEINNKLTLVLDTATDPWGIKVTRVELKNIMPPEEIQAAMEKEMRAERDKRQTVLEAEAHKKAVITRAEGDKQAMILHADGERDAEIARAKGKAEAIRLIKEAEAFGITAINDAHPSGQALILKKYDALVALANGQASKIIIPTDVANMAKTNVLFSELSGVGSVTPQGSAPKQKIPVDPCCDEHAQHHPGDSCEDDDCNNVHISSFGNRFNS